MEINCFHRCITRRSEVTAPIRVRDEFNSVRPPRTNIHVRVATILSEPMYYISAPLFSGKVVYFIRPGQQYVFGIDHILYLICILTAIFANPE